MRNTRQITDHSLPGREMPSKQKILALINSEVELPVAKTKKSLSPSDIEMLAAIKYMTEVHGTAGVGKFKESIGTILFRCILNTSPMTADVENAIADLYQITHLIGKIEEYQLNSK